MSDNPNLIQGRHQTGVLTDYRDQTKTGETFIKIGDITTGMGTHENFVDYVQYYSLLFSMDKPMNPDAHNKLYSASVTTISDIKVITANHHQIPVILQKLWTGDKVDTIETVRTENTEGGTLRQTEKIIYTDNYITKADYLGDKFEFWFRTLKIQLDKTPTKQTGEQEGVVSSGFDYTKNNLVG